MTQKKGSLSINSENIFPIIKKWLYSDHDIFVREMVSNGADAVTKLKKLKLMGEFEEPENETYRIIVRFSAKDKSLSFEDNGLGMTAEEVEEYINQIAFSGAKDFMEKYKDKANEDQIIGHFGLGFYSAFMVADRVAIDTLSYKKDAVPVHWESSGGTEFEMNDGTRAERGTVVTLWLNEDSVEFSNEFRIREVLEKYCSFMPVPIYLEDLDREPETEEIEKEDLKDTDTLIETIVEPAKTEEITKEDGTKATVEKEPAREKYRIRKRPVMLNDTAPLWTKTPSACTEEEYREFYRKVFRDYKEPLFWIHLNMDYPFNLKGILYFPKINTEYESIEGRIKLYNNQVFIADNIKEVIPEFLLLLKGVIDCPDLPLNVSRSALQNDGFVTKISSYITKKVADKLSGMFKTDRENYEKYWDDIAPFIKYGFLKDEKFAEKMNDYILFKNIDGKYLTLKDCMEENRERFENRIFYVTDEKEQSEYIRMFRGQKIDAVILPHNIDIPFMSALEEKNKDLKFSRIDADLDDAFREEKKEESEEEKKRDSALSSAVKKALSNDKLTVRVEALKDRTLSSVLTVSEESRRMQDMMRQYGMTDTEMFADDGRTLVLNSLHPLVEYLRSRVVVNEAPSDEKSAEDEKNCRTDKTDTENCDKIDSVEEKVTDGQGRALTKEICEQLYDLALIRHGGLKPDRLNAFVERSNQLLMELVSDKKQ